VRSSDVVDHHRGCLYERVDQERNSVDEVGSERRLQGPPELAFVWAIRLGASGVCVVAGTVSNSASGTVVYALATSRVYHRAARCTANCRNTDEKKYTVKIVHLGLLGANV
jgi:hypothetical protein